MGNAGYFSLNIDFCKSIRFDKNIDISVYTMLLVNAVRVDRNMTIEGKRLRFKRGEVYKTNSDWCMLLKVSNKGFQGAIKRLSKNGLISLRQTEGKYRTIKVVKVRYYDDLDASFTPKETFYDIAKASLNTGISNNLNNKPLLELSGSNNDNNSNNRKFLGKSVDKQESLFGDTSTKLKEITMDRISARQMGKRINDVRLEWNKIFIHNQIKSLKAWDREDIQILIAKYSYEEVIKQITVLYNLPIIRKENEISKAMSKLKFFIKPENFKKLIEGGYKFDDGKEEVYSNKKWEDGTAKKDKYLHSGLEAMQALLKKKQEE